MKRLSVFFIFLFKIIFCCTLVQADQNAILIEINGDKTTKEQFIRNYEKSNKHLDVDNRLTIEKYLDLYINFRLKVKEAKTLGYDTLDSFINEFEKYRKELSKPYLTDENVINQLVVEAYELMQYDLRASHILISINENAPPQDTIEAYNKIIELRNKAVQGEDFEKLAKEYSDDPSAQDRKASPNRRARKGNKGDLGYFTALQMDYSFENAAYNLEINEISMPVRSPHGYHIIKVADKKPSLGQLKLAHILKRTSPKNDNEKQQKAKSDIYDIYQKLKEGHPFDSLARKHSDDKRTAQRGGELDYTPANRLLPKIIEAIHKFDEIGEFSEPIHTQSGWHIIKLIDIDSLKPFNDIEYDLTKRVKNNPRSKLSEEFLINEIKKEYNFNENIDALEFFYDIVDESALNGKWNIPQDVNLDEELFVFANNSFTQLDFAEFIKENQKRRSPMPIYSYVKKMYDEFVNKTLMAYKESKLEEKYPEFKQLLTEYYEGILLFDLTNDKVWSKAMKDTTGLKEFYNNNTEQYIDDKKIDATIYSCPNKKTVKELRSQLKNFKEDENAHKKIAEIFNDDFPNKISIDKGVFYEEDEEILKKIEWKPGISKRISNKNREFIVHIHKVIPAKPKPLQEIRGLVVADYQSHLEKEWIKELRNKYQVSINDNVLEKTINEITDQ